MVIGIGIGIGLGAAPLSPSPITASVVASRTSGVAPLAVQLDLTGTTHESLSVPLSELDYWTDWGDGSAVFDGGNAGYCPGHVYDQPGTYVAVTYFRDILGNIASRSTTFTVTDPDVVFAGTATVCVSTSGDFTGAPSGCVQVTSSDFDAVVAAHLTSGKRLLCRRDETFVASAAISITVESASMIGAFGAIGSEDERGIADNAPIISVLHDNDAFGFGSNPTTCTDLRVVDLKFSYDNGGTPGHLFDLNFRADDLLVHCCTDASGKSFDQTFSLGDAIPASFGADVCHNVTVSNCYWNGGTGNDYGFYGAGRGIVLLNTYWGPQQAGSSGHVVRIQFGRLIHVAGCDFQEAAATKHALTIRAFDYVDADDETRFFVVDGNTFACSSVWCTHFGSESTGHRQHVDDGLIINNHFQFGAGSNNGYAIHSGGRRIVAANNTMDADSGAGLTSIRMFFSDNYGSAGQPDPSIQCFGNTVYSSIALSGNLRLINAPAGTAEVRNNLLWGASVGSYTVTTGGGTFTASNNISNTNPLFVSASDLHLTASSPAIAAGLQVDECQRDKDGVLRGAAIDVGAYEYVA